MAVTQQQPIAYISPTDSSIEESNEVIVTGASQGPPSISIAQQDPIVIEVTPWVA